MCDTKGHEHWCSACSKNLNRAPADSYIEIEWMQNDKGQIVEEKSMICKSCLEESENIKELNDFFKGLEYHPWGHIFCSACKKDLSQELGKDIEPGKDYECLNFKCHEKSGAHIRHIIKVVVLCKDCVKKELNAENLGKLKKLGKNPLFKPKIECPNTEICRQFSKGDEYVNCKNISIGRDRETLNFGLLCARRHKGCQLLPFDDGFSISRPRKGKGAAVASPQIMAVAPGLSPIQSYMTEIERMIKKYKLGKFGDPLPDYGRTFINIEIRLLQIEKTLNIQNDPNFSVANLTSIRPVQMSIKGESASVPNISEDIEKDIEHDEVISMPVKESKVIVKIPINEKRTIQSKVKKRLTKTK